MGLSIRKPLIITTKPTVSSKFIAVLVLMFLKCTKNFTYDKCLGYLNKKKTNSFESFIPQYIENYPLT